MSFLQFNGELDAPAGGFVPFSGELDGAPPVVQGDPMGAGDFAAAANAAYRSVFEGVPLPEPVVTDAQEGENERLSQRAYAERTPTVDDPRMLAPSMTATPGAASTRSEPQGREVGALKSLGLGLGRSFASTGKVASLAVVAPLVVAEKIKNAVTGSDDTSLQDSVFSRLIDPAQQAVDWYALEPGDRQGFLAKVADGLGGMLADLPLMIASGGLSQEAQAVKAAPDVARFMEMAVGRGFDAMRPVMVKAGVEKAQQVLDAGGTVSQALTSATTAAMATGYMGSQPMSAHGPVMERILTGIPVGAVTSEAHRVVQNAADPQALQQPFSPENMVVGGVTNAVMAGAMGESPPVRPEARPLSKAPPEAPSRPAAPPEPAPALDPVAAVRDAPTVDAAIKAASDAVTAPPPAGTSAVDAVERTLDRELSQQAQSPSVADQLRAVRPLETPDVGREAEVPAVPAEAAGSGSADAAPGVDVGVGAPAARVAAVEPAGAEPGRPAGPLPLEAGGSDAVAQGSPARPGEQPPLRPEGEPAGRQSPTLSPRPDGTLVITGERAALATLLRAHGITQILPVRDGVLVGRSDAEAAQRAVAPFVAVPRSNPEGAAHADRPGREQAGVQPERPNGDEGRPTAEAGGGDRVLGAAQGEGQAGSEAPRPQVAGPQPLSVWFGRAGDGYATKQDALNAMSARQRAQPDLVWQVEPMSSGKHRLAGYAAQDDQPQQPTVAAPELARDPFRTFLIRNGIALRLAKDFTPGVRERLAMGRTFRHDGLELDQLAERAAEQGYIHDRHDVEGLYDLITRSVSGERVGPLYGQEGDRELQVRMEQRQQMEHEQAVAALDALKDNELVAVADAFDGIPSLDAPSNTTTEAAMRALGFTEQEITDAIAQESRGAQADGAGRGETGEPGARKAPGADRAGEGQARPDQTVVSGEGLSRPSREEVLAQQQRRQQGERADAQRRADEAARADADARRGDYTLTGSDRAADANPAQHDLLAEPPPVSTKPERPADQQRLIELRKRKSVLESLLKCLG